MKENLKSSKFRWINEQLYTTEGQDAFNMIHKDKELFDTVQYSLRTWWIVSRRIPQSSCEMARSSRRFIHSTITVRIFHSLSASRKMKKHMQVGDFGCGDAFIYQQVKNHTIYSYDLISKHDYVIECDIAHVYSESRTESE